MKTEGQFLFTTCICMYSFKYLFFRHSQKVKEYLEGVWIIYFTAFVCRSFNLMTIYRK